MFDEQPDGDPHGECKLEIDRLEAELAKYQWQPIETAPKDGATVLLCYAKGNRVASGDFDGHCWVWPYVRREPTHWMPLPIPPTLDPLPVDVDGEPYFPRDKKCKCGAYVRKGYACTCCWRVWK